MAEKIKHDADCTCDCAENTAKERSKTDVFKEHIQKIVFNSLGVKVSKDKAWDLFKSTMHGTVEFVLNIQEGTDAEGNKTGKKLPLSGVGTFEILETKPRGSKAGLDPEGNPIEGAEVWPCVPRFRFYPSSTIDNLCEFKYGLGNHEIEEKHYGIFAPVEEAPAKDDKKATEPKKADKKAPKAEAKAEPATAEAPAEEDFDFSDDEL